MSTQKQKVCSNRSGAEKQFKITALPSIGLDRASVDEVVAILLERRIPADVRRGVDRPKAKVLPLG